MCNYSFSCLEYNEGGKNCDYYTGLICDNYSVVGIKKMEAKNPNIGKFCISIRKPRNNISMLNTYQLSIEDGALYIRIKGGGHRIGRIPLSDAVLWVYDIGYEVHITTSLLEEDCSVLIGMARTDENGDWIECNNVKGE